MKIFYILVAVCIALLDLKIKDHVEKHIDSHTEKEILDHHIIIRKVHNKGIALNILDSHPFIVRVLTMAAGTVMIFWMAFTLSKTGHRIEKCSVAMMLGGAASNIYDRLVRKYVVDYFAFQTKWKRFTDITFNLGDIFIFTGMIGVLILAISDTNR